MAGFAPSKIPGHSGTEFKHNIAFERPRKLDKKRTRLYNVAYTLDLGRESKIWSHSFVVMIKAFIIVLIVFCGYFIKPIITESTNFMFYDDLETIRNNGMERNMPRSLHEYFEFIHNADHLYNSGNYRLAHDTYSRGIGLVLENDEAWIGVTKSLLKMSETNPYYCTFAVDHVNYLEDRGCLANLM